MAFRADEGLENQGGSSFDVQIPRVTVRMSTFTKGRSYFNFGRFYVDTKGVDDTSVFDGAVHWTGTDRPGLGANPYDLNIRFSAPFLYDPAAGDLLISLVAQRGTGAVGFDFYDPSGLGATADGTETTSPLTNPRVVATQFDVTTVPEPSTILLLSIGIGALRAIRPHRSK